MKTPRKTKYGNVRTEFDGHVFDSMKEQRRYAELKMLEKGHIIHDLQLQVPFELQPGFRDDRNKWIKPITYVADFTYVRDGDLVIEDVKSFATSRDAVYRLKKKMMLYRGHRITEV